MDVDKIQYKLSKNLKFQVIAFICLGIIYARGAWNVFGVLFLAGGAGHSCDPIKEIITWNAMNQNKLLPLTNVTEDSLTTPLSPIQLKPKGIVVQSKECDVVVSTENGTNITLPCISRWVYSGEFESTIITEWDLVCVRAYLSELSTTLYLVGSMCGALFISALSDKFGRRLLVLICLLFQAALGACVALAQDYIVFTILRFIVGFFNMGIALSTYVMMTELFPSKQRSIPCCGLQIFWAIGIMLTALFGYMVRNWRHLQLVFSLPNLPCAIFVWFLPESLPWLISQGKYKKAQSVIERIARFNNIEIPDDLYRSQSLQQHQCMDQPDTSYTVIEQPLLSGTLTHREAITLLEASDGYNMTQVINGTCTDSIDEAKNPAHQMHGNDLMLQKTEFQRSKDEATVSDVASQCGHPGKKTCEDTNVFILCVTPRMRLYSLIIFYLFFVNGMSYFGISLSTPVLHGNQFFNLFLLGAVEIPAYILCVVLCERIGRKIPLCLFLLICGMMNITAVMISEEASSAMNGLRVACVMVGKFAITGAYTTVYLYSAEIFPTSVRNHAMGISSCFENFGSIAAPFIVFSAKAIPELPMILFGIVSIIGGVLVLLMPETHKRPLPQNIQEVESWDICSRGSKN